MRTIIYKIFKPLLIVIITLLVAISCDDPYKTIDYKKLEAEEMALLQEFLDLNLETMVGEAIDTIHKKTNGMIYFEMHKGTGDSILPGNIVGFRYKFFSIDRDKNDIPVLIEIGSNFTADDPFLYYAGTPSAPAYSGIDEGIKYMRHLGKSKMIVPSNVGNNNFYTIVAEIEVTYLYNR